MLNTNEKLLDELDADQYYLLSKITRYGKKCCPKNEVLCKATKWGIKRVQKAKKELIALGFLKVSNRWKIVDGKKVRDSNQYSVTTNLISKYNKKAPNYANIEQFVFEQFGSEPVQFELGQFELGQEGTDSNILRIVIIDNKELLKKVGKEPPLPEIKILSNLDKKKEKKEEPKSSAKKVTKGNHVFPDITSPKNYDSLSHFDRRTNKQLPFDVVSASETMNLLFPQKKDARKEYNSIYSEKASLEVIEKSWKTFIEKRFSNSFQEIRGVSILKKIFFEWTQKQVKFEKSNGFSFKKSNFRNNGVSVENELIDYDEQRDAKLREESRNQ